MDPSDRHAWLRAALLFGVFYLLIGRLFALPATHVQFWRLAAWAVSGLAYVAHISYERFRLRNRARTTAWHVAVAVAIGGFGLAVAGMINSLVTTSAIRPIWFLALVLFPIVTAVPAFLGALVAAAVLQRFPRHARAG